MSIRVDICQHNVVQGLDHLSWQAETAAETAACREALLADPNMSQQQKLDIFRGDKVPPANNPLSLSPVLLPSFAPGPQVTVAGGSQPGGGAEGCRLGRGRRRGGREQLGGTTPKRAEGGHGSRTDDLILQRCHEERVKPVDLKEKIASFGQRSPQTG